MKKKICKVMIYKFIQEIFVCKKERKKEIRIREIKKNIIKQIITTATRKTPFIHNK